MVRLFAIVVLLALAVLGCARQSEESSLARGKRMFDDGKWQQAIQALSEAIDKNPLEAEAYLYRGRAYHCQGPEHLTQAISDFDQAIKINPNNCEAYYSRSHAYKARGDGKKAFEDSITARQLDPNYASASSMYSSPSTERYQEILKHATESEKTVSPTGDVSTDALLNSALDAAPQHREKRDKDVEPDSEAAPNDTVKTQSPRGRRTASSDLRDAYGLPLSTERVGSVSEELFGAGRKGAGSGAAVNGLPPWGPVIGNRTPPELPASPPQALPQGQDSTPAKAASKPSPVGTLPFGNPYQPGGYTPYAPNSQYSPYLPVGPRSTGLRSDQPVSPYYDRRTNPYGIPSYQRGLQGPLVPPQ